MIEIGANVRAQGSRRIGVVQQLIEPKPGWHRALVSWGDGDQFVDIDKLEVIGDDRCAYDGELLTFDADCVGETVGGVMRRGWNLCPQCKRYTLSDRGVEVDGASSDAWTLAKGGRSLNCGGIRIRAEGKAGDAAVALMARIQKLPELEAEVERLRAELAARGEHAQQELAL